MKPLAHLMEKEMSRKEFLATLGLGVVSVLGFSSMLKFLFGKGAEQGHGSNAGLGYGASVYGGNKKI